MKKFVSMLIAMVFCFSLLGCENHKETHTKIEKTQSTNIALENDFKSIDSIKRQTDKLAKKISNKITLSEVFIHAPEGDFENGTAYFIYYGDSKGNATKVTYKIDIPKKAIVESKVQKGYPEEVGGAIPKGEFNTSVDIKKAIKDITSSDDFKNISSSITGAYDIELDFFANEVKVTAMENSRIFFENTL